MPIRTPERVERAKASRFPEGSLAHILSSRKEGQPTKEVQQLQSILSDVATVAVAKAIAPQNREVESSHKTFAEKKAVGSLPDPKQIADIPPEHKEATVVVQQELTEMFRETLKAHSDKPVDTELLALSLAQLHDPTITSLDDLLSQKGDTREHAIAVLAYDTALAIRPEGETIPKEQLVKEQAISAEAKKLNQQQNLFYISFNQSVDGARDNEAFHMEESYDKNNRPLLTMCAHHTEKSQKELHIVATSAQNVLDAQVPALTVKEAITKRVLRLILRQQKRIIGGPFFDIKRGPIESIVVKSLATTHAEQSSSVESIRVQKSVRSKDTAFDRQTGQQEREGKSKRVSDHNHDRERFLHQTQQGESVNGTQGQEENPSQRTIETTVRVKPTRHTERKSPANSNTNKRVSISAGSEVSSGKSSSPHGPEKPQPKVFGSEQKVVVTVNVAEQETGEVLARAIEQIRVRQEEEILVSAIRQENVSERRKESSHAVKRAVVQPVELERMVSERAGITGNLVTSKTPSIPLQSPLRKKQKGKTQKISDLAIALDTPGSLNSPWAIRETILSFFS